MWTEDLTVDNVEIDNQHKHLFSLLDRFYAGIKNNSPKAELQELVWGLLNYTKTHFLQEETYMQNMGFPELEAHKKQHELFVDKVNSYYSKITEGRLILSIEVTTFLKDWLINHIKGQDQKYGHYARSK